MRLVEIVDTLMTAGTLFSVILSPRGYWRTPECQEVAQMDESIMMETVEALFNFCLFPSMYWRGPKSRDVSGDRGDFDDGGINFV